ncbi:hypothetical protein ATANTOWER_001781 [Ataeniobius toweri]|uniref:Uncharacterized protein n=1 Tax=Ataeniobius toweri TaxID=208326 RepID=A0ABU7BSC2_9TELE|nr:hypothetical protein [Ataeniobius toweri]
MSLCMIVCIVCLFCCPVMDWQPFQGVPRTPLEIGTSSPMTLYGRCGYRIWMDGWKDCLLPLYQTVYKSPKQPLLTYYIQWFIDTIRNALSYNVFTWNKLHWT